MFYYIALWKWNKKISSSYINNKLSLGQTWAAKIMFWRQKQRHLVLGEYSKSVYFIKMGSVLIALLHSTTVSTTVSDLHKRHAYFNFGKSDTVLSRQRQIFFRDRMSKSGITRRNGDSWQPWVDVIIPCVKELVLASKRGIVPLQPGCR